MPWHLAASLYESFAAIVALVAEGSLYFRYRQRSHLAWLLNEENAKGPHGWLHASIALECLVAEQELGLR